MDVSKESSPTCIFCGLLEAFGQRPDEPCPHCGGQRLASDELDAQKESRYG